MKIVARSGGFVFDLTGNRSVGVTFFYDRGQPTKVILKFTDGVGNTEIPNSDGRWKPCATHCKKLIENAVRCASVKPPRSKRLRTPKVDEQKATLKIYRG